MSLGRTVGAQLHGVSEIQEAAAALRRGELVVILESVEPDAQGVLVLAAQHADEHTLRLLAKEGSGLFGLCLSDARCDALGLRTSGGDDDNLLATLTPAISHRDAPPEGSYSSRAFSIRRAADPLVPRREFVQPGLVPCFRAHPTGVIAHPGYPEAAIDLARIAGLLPAVVEAFPMERSGEYRTVPRILPWARRKNIEVISIPQIVEYQWQHQRLLEKAASVRLPTRYTALRAAAYVDPRNGSILLTLVSGDVRGREDVLLHMRRSCFPGDTLHSTACGCRLMLDEALARLDSEPGVLIYLTSDRSAESLLSCPLEAGGSLGADDALLAAQIVADLGVSSVRLLGEESEKPEVANALSVSAFETLRPAV